MLLLLRRIYFVLVGAIAKGDLMEQEHAQWRRPWGEPLLRNLLDAAAIGIAVEDLEGQPLFANPALCSMLGFTEEELLSKHCVEFSPPEDAKKDWAFWEQLRQGSIDSYHLDKRFFRKDGTLIWGRLSISLMKERAGFIVTGRCHRGGHQ
jgi:PAS domain S-box-containing protein